MVWGSSGGSYIVKKLYPLHLFFSGELSGVAQKKIRGSVIRKKLYPLHLVFFDCYAWYLRGSRGFSGVLEGSWGLLRAVQGQMWGSLSGKRIRTYRKFVWEEKKPMCRDTILLQGVPKKRKNRFLLNISATKYQIFKSFFFLLKTEIHTQIWIQNQFCVILGGRDIYKTK